jgi:GAF domain-containing protein
VPGRAWSSGEPVWLADAAPDATSQRVASAAVAGNLSTTAFPVRSGSTVLGVIEYFSYAIHPPDTDLLQTMAAVGSQIGQFIERMQAQDALHRAKDELELKVAERTTALRRNNEQLRHELVERRRTEAALEAKTRE